MCGSAKEEEKKGRFGMRKIALVLAVLLFASPAFAGVVIECTADSTEVTVSYDTNDLDPNLIRAVAIDVNVDNGAIIDSVSTFDPCYGIYPGSIDINDTNGTIDAVGSAVCDPVKYPDDTLGGVGTAGMTIEMGSLYVGAANAPGSDGDLFKFVIDMQGADDCNVILSLNSSRGGVVMEDTAVAADALLKGCSVSGECYAGQPDYDQWEAVEKPDCWCYPRQCEGDADGLKQGSAYLGYYYVGTDDIDIVSLGWKVKNSENAGRGILDLTVGGVPVACGDFDHQQQGSAYLGYYRIGTDDIDIMSLYWKEKEGSGNEPPAACQPGNRTP